MHLPVILLWLALASTRGLTVNNGAYSNLVVEIKEDLPRQHCHRAIHNLKVRIGIEFESLYLLSWVESESTW